MTITSNDDDDISGVIEISVSGWESRRMQLMADGVTGVNGPSVQELAGVVLQSLNGIVITRILRIMGSFVWVKSDALKCVTLK